MITVFKLKDGIASFRDSDPDDVIKAKLAFTELDEFEPDPELGINGFMDGQLDTTIRRFQRTHGLLETGEIKAGDDTEKAINAELRMMERQRSRSSPRNSGAGRQPASFRLSPDARKFSIVGPGNVNTGEDADPRNARRRSEQFGDIEDEFAGGPQRRAKERASERMGDIEADIERRTDARERLELVARALSRTIDDILGQPRRDEKLIRMGKSVVTPEAARLIIRMSELKPPEDDTELEAFKAFLKNEVHPELIREIREEFGEGSRASLAFQEALSNILEGQALDEGALDVLVSVADAHNRALQDLIRNFAPRMRP